MTTSKKKKVTIKVATSAKPNRQARRAHLQKPKTVTISGHGDYRPTNFVKVRGRGDYASDIGGFIGNTLGGLASKGVGAIGKILGFGDYRIAKNNSLMSKYMTPQGGLLDADQFPMKMGAMSVQFGTGPARLGHREFICPIVATGSSAFSTMTFPINPGRSGGDSLFPWGSQTAINFEQYEMHGMILEYHSTSSEFSTQVGLGSISMSTIYDAQSPPLDSLDKVLNNEYSTTDKPSQSFIHPIECASKDNPITLRYVKANNSDSISADERFDDVGLFQISISGIPSSVPAGTELGQLWCVFDFSLHKPKLGNRKNGSTFYATGYKNSGATFPAFLDTRVLSPENSLPAKFIDSTTISMPSGYPGNYMLILQYRTAVTAAFTGVPSIRILGSGITPIPLFTNLPTALGESTIATAFGQGCIFMTTFTSASQGGPEGYINFNTGITNDGSSPIGASFFIVPLDDDINSTLNHIMRKHRMLSIPEAFERYSDIEPFRRSGVLPAAAMHKLSSQHQALIDGLKYGHMADIVRPAVVSLPDIEDLTSPSLPPPGQPDPPAGLLSGNPSTLQSHSIAHELARMHLRGAEFPPSPPDDDSISQSGMVDTHGDEIEQSIFITPSRLAALLENAKR